MVSTRPLPLPRENHNPLPPSGSTSADPKDEQIEILLAERDAGSWASDGILPPPRLRRMSRLSFGFHGPATTIAEWLTSYGFRPVPRSRSPYEVARLRLDGRLAVLFAACIVAQGDDKQAFAEWLAGFVGRRPAEVAR